jgi:hypothetical protein
MTSGAVVPLRSLGRKLLAEARTVSAGRAARTVVAVPGRARRQAS